MKIRIIYILTALISIVLFYGTFIKTPIAIANNSSPSAEIEQTAPLLNKKSRCLPSPNYYKIRTCSTLF